MRLPLVIGVVLWGTACGAAAPAPTTVPTTAPTITAPPASSAANAPAPTTAAALPPEPVPARTGTCPYLTTSFVADTNGQRVSVVRLSADQPYPACFFYRADGAQQLRVQVVTGVDPTVARALVDRAAPVASSDPASLPGGWEGGKQPTDTGAVFAVARGGTAVVVVTNQKQTIKASRIAEQAISALAL